jgi:DNA-binding NtrC family response regulator
MEDNRPLKLLVVDDEETIVYFTEKIFSKKGFTTFGATDGIAALEIFQKERPQIIIIDVHMPFSAIDGVETLRRIKEIDKDAVCLMVTRITSKEAVEDSKRYGALAYLRKPLDLDDLENAVERAKAYIKA